MNEQKIYGLLQYIALQNPSAIRKVLYEVGGYVSENIKDNINELAFYLNSENRFDVLKKLMEYHPDRELVIIASEIKDSEHDNSKNYQLEIHQKNSDVQKYQGFNQDYWQKVSMGIPPSYDENIKNAFISGFMMYGGTNNTPNKNEKQNLSIDFDKMLMSLILIGIIVLLVINIKKMK